MAILSLQAAPSFVKKHCVSIVARLTALDLLCSVPAMNRLLLTLLIVAFACVQSLSLHAHLPHAHDQHASDHDAIHVHSHATTGADGAHEYSDAVEIDLLSSAFARDQASPVMLFTVSTWFALIITILWFCIRRLPPPLIPALPSPPPHRRPSPRAPPL